MLAFGILVRETLQLVPLLWGIVEMVHGCYSKHNTRTLQIYLVHYIWEMVEILDGLVCGTQGSGVSLAGTDNFTEFCRVPTCCC